MFIVYYFIKTIDKRFFKCLIKLIHYKLNILFKII